MNFALHAWRYVYLFFFNYCIYKKKIIVRDKKKNQTQICFYTDISFWKPNFYNTECIMSCITCASLHVAPPPQD